ncbi:MAG TPA: DUF4388 domain-containing protein [Polyangiaceae bacterium]|nr:DUF4388 domain-containing protein [Polyangiaceae bacterium]
MKESNSLALEGLHSPAPGARAGLASLRPPPGFTAHLTGMSLTDLVRLQAMTDASGVFLVVSGERSGLLHFVQGQLLHAETRDLRGDPAALEILGWAEGDFIRSERPPSGAATVASPLDSLLAQALGITGLSSSSRSMAATGVRRRSEARDVAPELAERNPSSTRDLRAAATPGIAAAPAPRRSSKLPEGRALASALVSPLGDLVEGRGDGADALATRVAYVARLSEVIGQAMGSGETRALRVRYADSELAIHPRSDGHVYGCSVAPEAH